jgi:hypothetical protein
MLDVFKSSISKKFITKNIIKNYNVYQKKVLGKPFNCEEPFTYASCEKPFALSIWPCICLQK